MVKFGIQRVFEHFEEIYTTQSVFTLILRGHLYCEAVLAFILHRALKNPDEMNIGRIEFQRKVQLGCALGLIPLKLKPALVKLGNLRNRLAHQLDSEITEQDQLDFLNAIKSNMGANAAFYLRRNLEYPNGLRRGILALWIPLAAIALNSDEKKEIIPEMIKFAAILGGKGEDEVLADMEILELSS